MQIEVLAPVLQTLFFGIIFVLALLFSIRKIQPIFTLSKNLTDELKGFAILAVVFSHIGYFLSKDSSFLFPFSILAGAGVNLFLFLSGFGLTLSALKNDYSILDFYKKRLKKIYIPMWIALGSLLLLDIIILKRSYSLEIIIQNLLGWFPSADIFNDLDSPLWYFSWIAFYYLTFPLLFWKKIPFLSPLLILIASMITINFLPLINENVDSLYNLHTLAFPLGVLLAIILNKWGEKIAGLKLHIVIRAILLIIGALTFAYFAYYSGVGKSPVTEQGISILIMFLAVIIFVLKNVQFRLFSLFGIYSYEIYLLHWPLMYRYDILYKNLPPFVATVIYLAIFLTLGFLLQKLIETVPNLFSKTTPRQALPL